MRASRRMRRARFQSLRLRRRRLHWGVEGAYMGGEGVGSVVWWEEASVTMGSRLYLALWLMQRDMGVWARLLPSSRALVIFGSEFVLYLDGAEPLYYFNAAFYASDIRITIMLRYAMMPSQTPENRIHKTPFHAIPAYYTPCDPISQHALHSTKPTTT